jgi:hypothetical protein
MRAVGVDEPDVREPRERAWADRIIGAVRKPDR